VFKGVAIAEEGIDELRRILEYLPAMEIEMDKVDVDFSIARGLDYYTGPVMEQVLLDAPEFGSIFSGGRYNDLVSRFTGKELPATGASMGVDRLFAALSHLGAIDGTRQTVSDVMIIRIEKDNELEYLKIASELHAAGVNAELSLLDDITFKGQFHFAIGRGVKYIVIQGQNELDKNTIQVKNLETRKQVEIPRDELTDYFK
ncbi:MAG: histidine--tRNA ligase, partial [Desulfobacterales bacterium]|nr:histidine--tRNA ligase [Desulfobacterales bacterium]